MGFQSFKIEAVLGAVRGSNLGLNRKQGNKRIRSVVASLCPGSVFLKSSERPAGQVLSSRAGRGDGELCPAFEKSGTPRKYGSLCTCDGVSVAGPEAAR